MAMSTGFLRVLDYCKVVVAGGRGQIIGFSHEQVDTRHPSETVDQIKIIMVYGVHHFPLAEFLDPVVALGSSCGIVGIPQLYYLTIKSS